MRLEEFSNRQAGGEEQSGSAIVKPAKVIRVENNFGRIAVREFNQDAFAAPHVVAWANQAGASRLPSTDAGVSGSLASFFAGC